MNYLFIEMKLRSFFILILIHWTVATSLVNIFREEYTFEKLAREEICNVERLGKMYAENCRITTQEIRYLEEEANANATVLCYGSYYINLLYNPALFIIEQYSGDSSLKNWKKVGAMKSNKTKESFVVDHKFDHLFRFWRVLEGGISQPETTKTISSVMWSAKRKIVINLSVESFIAQATDPPLVKVAISVDTSEYRPCSCDVTLQDAEHPYKKHIESRDFPLVIPEINYSNLPFNTNYTVVVTCRGNPDKRYFHGETTIRTPKCVEFLKNLTICPPQEVQGINSHAFRKQGNIFDVEVIWENPSELRPDYYIVKLYPNSSNHMNEPPILIKVSGRNSASCFPNVTILDKKYAVGIIACSSGGRSLQVLREFPLSEVKMNSSLKLYSTVATSTGISVLMMIIGAIALYCCKKQKRRGMTVNEDSNPEYSTVDETLDDVGNLEPVPVEVTVVELKAEDQLNSFDKYEIDPKRLELKHCLGSGAFGIVRLGYLRDEAIFGGLVTKVAVKMLPDHPTETERRDFEAEIEMMKLIGRHPNIVSLIGCCTVGTNPLLIVEYCSKGDLQSFLRAILAKVSPNWIFEKKTRWISKEDLMAEEKRSAEGPSPNDGASNSEGISIASALALDPLHDDVGVNACETLSMSEMLNFGLQVAQGMDYLSSNRIVHRDLAARNILVCEGNIVKISDFGLSRDIYLEDVYTKRSSGRLPMKWIAIEALTHQVYKSSSDVWSFGILLWEIFTLGSNPYPSIPPTQLLDWLQSGNRMNRPKNCSLVLYDLMLSCWKARPEDRPTFSILCEKLDELISIGAEND